MYSSIFILLSMASLYLGIWKNDSILQVLVTEWHNIVMQGICFYTQKYKNVLFIQMLKK